MEREPINGMEEEMVEKDERRTRCELKSGREEKENERWGRRQSSEWSKSRLCSLGPSAERRVGCGEAVQSENSVLYTLYSVCALSTVDTRVGTSVGTSRRRRRNCDEEEGGRNIK